MEPVLVSLLVILAFFVLMVGGSFTVAYLLDRFAR